MVAKKRKAETAKKKTTTTTKNNAKKKKTINQKKKADDEEKPNSSKFGLRCDAFDAGFSKRVKNFPKFDAEGGSSVHGVSSLPHKDHRRWTLDLRSDWRFFHVLSFVVNFSASLLLPTFTPEELERSLLFPEACSKLIELVCRLMAENQNESNNNNNNGEEKEVVKQTLTIGDWEGQLIWLCGELADENPDEFPHGNPLDAQEVLADASEAKMKKLKTFFSVDPMTRLDILCALCEDKAVQSEIVKENMEDRAERAKKVERFLELENEKKKRMEMKRLNGVRFSEAIHGGVTITPEKRRQQKNMMAQQFTDDPTVEVLRDRDVHGHSVGTDSEGRYYFTLGDASPRVWRWDKLKEADAKEVFSYDGVEPAWQTISCTLDETEALAIVLERSSGAEDRELAQYLKNAFIPLHEKQRAVEMEAKKRKEAKLREEEAKEREAKREAEYRAQENRKRSGRIAVKMIEQEQARLEKIKQEKWESEKSERMRAALITMNDDARKWMFLPLRLREKTAKPVGLPVDAIVVQKGKQKPKAVLNRPDAMFVSLKDLNKTTLTKKKRVFGAACVNKFFSILWAEDGGWYDGCVVSYNEATQEHFVVYEEGSMEHVNLDKQRIKFKYDVAVTKHVDEATDTESYSWKKKSASKSELSIDELLITQQDQNRENNEVEPAVMLEYVTGHHPETVLALDTAVFDVNRFHRHKPTEEEEKKQGEIGEGENDDSKSIIDATIDDDVDTFKQDDQDEEEEQEKEEAEGEQKIVKNA